VPDHALDIGLRCCFTSGNTSTREEKAKYAASQMGFGFGR
jgi:hypothetical protein